MKSEVHVYCVCVFTSDKSVFWIQHFHGVSRCFYWPTRIGPMMIGAGVKS